MASQRLPAPGVAPGVASQWAAGVAPGVASQLLVAGVASTVSQSANCVFFLQQVALDVKQPVQKKVQCSAGDAVQCDVDDWHAWQQNLLGLRCVFG